MVGGKYDFGSAEFFVDPFPTLTAMREQDPVYWHPGLAMWIVTRHSDVHLVSRDARFSAERLDAFFHNVPPHLEPMAATVREFFGGWMVLMDAPDHTRIRSLVNKVFSPRAVGLLRAGAQQLIDQILNRYSCGETFDLISELALPVPSHVIALMLGVPPDDMPTFEGWTRDAFRVITMVGDPEENLRLAYDGVVNLEAYLRTKIASRATDPSEDILSGLVHSSDAGETLSEQELVSTCAMLLNAALETTSGLIGNAVLALSENRSQFDLLRRSPDLIGPAIEEVLRYDGAAPGILRATKVACDLGDQTVAAGDLVLGVTHAANRDPRVFVDPDTFRVEREDAFKHIAFGHGPHSCLGAALARMEAQLTIGALIQKFPNLSVPICREGLPWLHSLAVRGVTSLSVTT